MQLSFEAQLAILAAALSLVSGLIGYSFRMWLDRREQNRKAQKTKAESEALAIRTKLLEAARRDLGSWEYELKHSRKGDKKAPFR